MAKKWHPEVWTPVKIKLDLSKEYYGPSEDKSFYRQQDRSEGYEVQGLGPTFREIKNPQKGSYQ